MPFPLLMLHLPIFARTQIDVFEWDQADVRMVKLPGRAQWNTYAKAHAPLGFSTLRLAHAVAKADFLVQRSLLLPSLGFILQMDQIVGFGHGGLVLAPGAAASLSDVTQSSLSGRFGQGLAILFAESRGYRFVGHLASDPSVIAYKAAKAREGRPAKASKASKAASGDRVADFIFENAAKGRMILESKASFTLAQNDPSKVKGVLKNALTHQVDPWMTMLSPAPSKGFAVYSLLREGGGPAPSALVFVDPPEQDPQTPLELSPAWVRRRNYAGWLRFMGLPEIAARLLTGDRFAPETVRLLVGKIEGRQVAFPYYHRVQPDPIGAVKRGYDVAAGMDVKALHAIGLAIQGDETALLEYGGPPSVEVAVRPPAEARLAPQQSPGDLFELGGSFLGDGTYLGAQPHQLGVMEFAL